MENNIYTFISQNSPDGGFLQSDQWRKFQEAVGKRTFHLEEFSEPRGGEASLRAWANIIEHQLPIIGKYFYIPRGPLGELKIEEVIELARKERAGWIRIDTLIKGNKYKIIKAPHDMQPKEIFVIDISKAEDEILVEMKPKTRYNIHLAEKKGITIKISNTREDIEKFCDLVAMTARRQKIVPHPGNYYQKMFEVIPAENIRLYCAEYKGKVIAANIVIFFGNTATYLHGASDDEFKNLMAPYLLQWRQIQDAKRFGAAKYDFGGVKINSGNGKDWAGVTRFKLGFSPDTQPVEFPGSYDIVVNPAKYDLYRLIQKVKSFL